MLFLEEGLFSYTRHADEQQRMSCCRDAEASAGLRSGARGRAHVQKACLQSKQAFNFGKEACSGLHDKSLLGRGCVQLCSAVDVKTIGYRQPRAKIPNLLCYQHSVFCLSIKIFLRKRCGQRAAASCQDNLPLGGYYQPVLDGQENEKVV